MAKAFSSSYLAGSHSGAVVAAAKKCMFSAWVRLDGGNGSNMTVLSFLESGGGGFNFSRLSTNVFNVSQSASGGGAGFVLRSTNTYLAGEDWIHVLASVDPAESRWELYVNDTSDDTVVVSNNVNLENAFTLVNVARRAVTDDQLFTGAVFDLLYVPGVSLDLSDPDNRRFFISDDLKPVGYTEFLREYGDASILLSGALRKNTGFIPFNLAPSGTVSATFGPETYRPTAGYGPKGERWFDSEQSGFSYPRSQTFIERREGLTSNGLRLGADERDDTTRLENPSYNYQGIIFVDDEEDDEEDDR